ncbi:MAG: transglycosylase family protein [Ornithinimicrobium sp.]
MAVAVGLFGMSAPAAQAASVWDRVAQCESGGRWAVNTGNGFHGGLQFHPATWNGFGGRAYASYAHRATKSQQIAIARRVLARQGPGAWPVCSKKAGLTRSNGRANANATASGGSVGTSPSKSTGTTVTRYVSAQQSANVRSGPSSRYRVVGQERRGARVSGTLRNGWMRMSGNRWLGPAVLSTRPVSGATSSRSSRPAASGTVTRYVSARVSAHVRSGPGTSYRIVDRERRGTKVRGKVVKGWLKIGTRRYIGTSVLSSRRV